MFRRANCLRRSWPVGINPYGDPGRFGACGSNHLRRFALLCLPRLALLRQTLPFDATAPTAGAHLLRDMRKRAVERVVPHEGLLPDDGSGLAITIQPGLLHASPPIRQGLQLQRDSPWNGQQALMPCAGL